MNCVLQLKMIPHRKCHFKSKERLIRRNAQVKEEGPVSPQHSKDLLSPFNAPLQIFFVGFVVVISIVFDPLVVWWRGNDNINRLRIKLLQALNAIAMLYGEL